MNKIISVLTSLLIIFSSTVISSAAILTAEMPVLAGNALTKWNNNFTNYVSEYDDYIIMNNDSSGYIVGILFNDDTYLYLEEASGTKFNIASSEDPSADLKLDDVRTVLMYRSNGNENIITPTMSMAFDMKTDINTTGSWHLVASTVSVYGTDFVDGNNLGSVQYQAYEPDLTTISARTGQQLTFNYFEDKQDVFYDAEATGQQVIHHVRHIAGAPFGGFLAGTNRYQPFSNISADNYVPFMQTIQVSGFGVNNLYDLDGLWAPELGSNQRLTIIPSTDSNNTVSITVDQNKCTWVKSSAVTGVEIASNLLDEPFDEYTPGGQGTTGWIPDGYDDSNALTDGPIEYNTLEQIKNAIMSFINGITSTTAAGATAIGVMISSGSDFMETVGDMFHWLPEELAIVIVSGLILLVVIGVLKMLL